MSDPARRAPAERDFLRIGISDRATTRVSMLAVLRTMGEVLVRLAELSFDEVTSKRQFVFHAVDAAGVHYRILASNPVISVTVVLADEHTLDPEKEVVLQFVPKCPLRE